MGDDQHDEQEEIMGDSTTPAAGTPPPALGLERQPLWTRHETNISRV